MQGARTVRDFTHEKSFLLLKAGKDSQSNACGSGMVLLLCFFPRRQRKTRWLEEVPNSLHVMTSSVHPKKSSRYTFTVAQCGLGELGLDLWDPQAQRPLIPDCGKRARRGEDRERESGDPQGRQGKGSCTLRAECARLGGKQGTGAGVREGACPSRAVSSVLGRRWVWLLSYLH